MACLCVDWGTFFFNNSFFLPKKKNQTQLLNPIPLQLFPAFISIAPAVTGLCSGKTTEIAPRSFSLECLKNREGVVLGGEEIARSGSSSLNSGGISRNALEAGFGNNEIWKQRSS